MEEVYVPREGVILKNKPLFVTFQESILFNRPSYSGTLNHFLVSALFKTDANGSTFLLSYKKTNDSKDLSNFISLI